MPDTNPQETLDTSASEFRLNRLESAWRGEPMPRWQEHVPGDDEPCSPSLIFNLLQMEIEHRIKAGLPALLAERYFEHPRLQKEDARLTDEQQEELIRWEYQLRWQIGQQARRAEYESAFPEHADAVREMKPQSRCPLCRKLFVLDETYQTRYCPTCESASPSTHAGPHPEFDPRGYQLVEQLGKGGMGEVYRCGDPALGRDLAIKVMKIEYLGHAEAERRFLREARVTGSLQHPGIVPVHNLGRLADGRLHYTMRLVRGDTFADILEKEAGKPERLPDLLSIFEKICQAVAYAHSKRVIHRDLKPRNVMVGKFGEVQVMDWGLAKLLTPDSTPDDPKEMTDMTGTRIFTESADTPVDLSRAGVRLGTFPYMPSEQARGKWNLVDERADVFALGSILCEILTGQPAYIGTNFHELCERAERGDVTEALQRLQHCGADAALTVLRSECLSPQREDRPRDAAAVAKRVAEYQAEVQERLRQAELERVAAEARAKAETERAQEALARVKAERRASRRLLVLAAAVIVFVLAGGAGLVAGLLAVSAEQRRTQDALDQVTTEQEKSQAAWKQTHEALNTLTDDIIEELLGKQVVLGEKEKAFLRKVLGFYEQFATERGDGEESRRVAVEGQFRVAKLHASLGKGADAEEGFRTAAGLYAKLAVDFPAVPKYRQGWANSLRNLGYMLRERGTKAEAEKVYQQSIGLLELLVRDFPAVPEYAISLAGSHMDLGVLLKHQRRTGSMHHYHEGITLLEKLVEGFPAERQYRLALASSYDNLAILLGELGKHAEAESIFHQAIGFLEKLVQESSDKPRERFMLAQTYSNLGWLQYDLSNKRGEAEKAIVQAIGHLELLVWTSPRMVSAQKRV